MWSYHPDLLAKQVPRYTSYPTAMEFAEDVGADDYARALDAVDSATPVSLYVHIPFCENICWYCGCNTGAAGRKQRLDDDLTARSEEPPVGTEGVKTCRSRWVPCPNKKTTKK